MLVWLRLLSAFTCTVLTEAGTSMSGTLRRRVALTSIVASSCGGSSGTDAAALLPAAPARQAPMSKLAEWCFMPPNSFYRCVRAPGILAAAAWPRQQGFVTFRKLQARRYVAGL